MLKQYSAEVVYPAQCTIGEGPVWDAVRQRLYWVAIMDQAIHLFDPATGQDRAIPVHQYAGCVAPTRGKRLVVTLHHGFYWLDPETGALEAIFDPEADKPENRFNDGAVDPAGRLWAGTLALENTPKVASLYRLDPDLTVHTMLTGISNSNGLTWSPDARTMYYIDTPTFEVSAFDYEIETGNISGRRTIIKIEEGVGYPDGMTADAEGMLWIAVWGSSRVFRYDPRTGKVIGEVVLPVTDVTSCEFGGPKLDQLYITTAGGYLPPEKAAEQPHAGDLFVAQLDVPGLPPNVFAAQ